MSVVVFDFQDFILEFPEWANVEESFAQRLFQRATTFLNNTDKSIICNVDIRREALYLLVAHFLEINSRGGGAVGTLSSATEGSVSASYSSNNSNIPAPWNQTTYGCDYWTLVLPYRLGPLYIKG